MDHPLNSERAILVVSPTRDKVAPERQTPMESQPVDPPGISQSVTSREQRHVLYR